MPHDLPPWYVVYQQMRRWMAAQWFTVTGFVSPGRLRILLDPAQRLNANTPAFRSTATREIPRAAGLIRPSTSS